MSTVLRRRGASPPPAGSPLIQRIAQPLLRSRRASPAQTDARVGRPRPRWRKGFAFRQRSPTCGFASSALRASSPGCERLWNSSPSQRDATRLATTPHRWACASRKDASGGWKQEPRTPLRGTGLVAPTVQRPSRLKTSSFAGLARRRARASALGPRIRPRHETREPRSQSPSRGSSSESRIPTRPPTPSPLPRDPPSAGSLPSSCPRSPGSASPPPRPSRARRSCPAPCPCHRR